LQQLLDETLNPEPAQVQVINTNAITAAEIPPQSFAGVFGNIIPWFVT